MGLKDFLGKKSTEHFEKERGTSEKAGQDTTPMPLHPLRKRDSALLDDYVLGQLILRTEMPPQEADGKLLFLFVKSLGWNQEHLNEISQVASIYDEQAKIEHLEKLGKILRKDDEIECFLCDIALLHGKEYRFDGEVLDFWRNVCFGVFNLDEKRADFLEKLCRAISGGRQSAREDVFGNVSKNVIDYCLAWHSPVVSRGGLDAYLAIDLASGSTGEYPVRPMPHAPNLSDDTCRTTELWLRRIPAGTFIMGSPSNELGRSNNEGQHTVTLTQDFYIGIFPVTQRQWELVMGSNSLVFKASGSSMPVVQVSYDDICGLGRPWPSNSSVSPDSFLGRLRSKTKQEGFDLPTEAQWEYACRAETTTALNNGMDLTSLEGSCRNLNDVGWYCMNSGGKTHPVGQKQPNAWELYDMHGNVWEWCRDWYGDYPSGNVTDPLGAGSGSGRVNRGGGWINFGRRCRAAHRNYNSPDSSGNRLGFRLVLVPAQ